MRKATCGSLRRRYTECCDNDGYVLYQRSQVTDIVPGLKYMLDHYERIESGANDKIERLKRKMEEHNHIMLLPGVVYGFALRNRKWGESRVTLNLNAEYDAKLRCSGTRSHSAHAGDTPIERL